jgi:hypothetical protein
MLRLKTDAKRWKNEAQKHSKLASRLGQDLIKSREEVRDLKKKILLLEITISKGWK